jgi:hypothetical protein
MLRQSFIFWLILGLSFASPLSGWAKAKKHRRHSPPQKQLACPPGLSNLGPEALPFRTYRLNAADAILICVPPEAMENGELKGKYLYQYEASLFRQNKFVSRVFSGSQKTPVRFKLKNGDLHEIMHLNFRDEFYPLYSEKIVCSQDECKRKEKSCVFNQSELSPLGPKEFEREKVIYAKGAGQIQEITEVDLAQMFNLALRGRKLAVEFFTTLQPKPLVSGPAAEIFQHMRSLLNEMTEVGCLKTQD